MMTSAQTLSRSIQHRRAQRVVAAREETPTHASVLLVLLSSRGNGVKTQLQLTSFI